MITLLEDLIDEVKSCSRKTLPLMLKNVIGQFDLDESDLCDELGISDCDLEEIMFYNKKIDVVTFMQIRRRLCRVIRDNSDSLEHMFM